MAQYDIAFVVNTASSGVTFQEVPVKLAKGDLLVGTATTPTVLPAATNGQMLVYDNTIATGFTTKKWNEFDDLEFDGMLLRNKDVNHCYIYLGDDGVTEIGAGYSTQFDGDIDLRSHGLSIRAQDVFVQSLAGTGPHLTIDATTGKITRTTIASGDSNWTVNGANIWRNSRVGIKQSSPAYDLDVTGDIRATGDILSNSDIRLKRNVKPLGDVTKQLKKLKPRTFDWIANDKHDVGLIAQEVEEIFPELVRTDDNGFKTINYSKLTVFLLKALQEMM
jgi:hypothetical protein